MYMFIYILEGLKKKKPSFFFPFLLVGRILLNNYNKKCVPVERGRYSSGGEERKEEEKERAKERNRENERMIVTTQYSHQQHTKKEQTKKPNVKTICNVCVCVFTVCFCSNLLKASHPLQTPACWIFTSFFFISFSYTIHLFLHPYHRSTK